MSSLIEVTASPAVGLPARDTAGYCDATEWGRNHIHPDLFVREESRAPDMDAAKLAAQAVERVCSEVSAKAFVRPERAAGAAVRAVWWETPSRTAGLVRQLSR